MKWLKVVTIILVVLIVTTMAATISLTQVFSRYKGVIEGTGFINQELNRVGVVRYDVDDDGNIYFATTSMSGDGIVIYNDKGDYKYTLPIETLGALGVKIDEDNNILVYIIRQNLIVQYNNMGTKIKTIEDVGHSRRSSFFWPENRDVRERNGVRYMNTNGTIIKEENGVKTVVFTTPVWQRWKSVLTLILVLSCVALFFRIAVPLWIKAYRDR